MTVIKTHHYHQTDRRYSNLHNCTSSQKSKKGKRLQLGLLAREAKKIVSNNLNNRLNKECQFRINEMKCEIYDIQNGLEECKISLNNLQLSDVSSSWSSILKATTPIRANSSQVPAQTTSQKYASRIKKSKKYKTAGAKSKSKMMKTSQTPTISSSLFTMDSSSFSSTLLTEMSGESDYPSSAQSSSAYNLITRPQSNIHRYYKKLNRMNNQSSENNSPAIFISSPPFKTPSKSKRVSKSKLYYKYKKLKNVPSEYKKRYSTSSSKKRHLSSHMTAPSLLNFDSKLIVGKAKKLTSKKSNRNQILIENGFEMARTSLVSASSPISFGVEERNFSCSLRPNHCIVINHKQSDFNSSIFEPKYSSTPILKKEPKTSTPAHTSYKLKSKNSSHLSYPQLQAQHSDYFSASTTHFESNNDDESNYDVPAPHVDNDYQTPQHNHECHRNHHQSRQKQQHLTQFECCFLLNDSNDYENSSLKNLLNLNRKLFLMKSQADLKEIFIDTPFIQRRRVVNVYEIEENQSATSQSSSYSSSNSFSSSSSSWFSLEEKNKFKKLINNYNNYDIKEEDQEVEIELADDDNELNRTHKSSQECPLNTIPNELSMMSSVSTVSTVIKCCMRPLKQLLLRNKTPKLIKKL